MCSAPFFAGHFLNICKNDLLPSPLQKAGCFFGPGQKHHWFDWWCQLLQYIPNQHIQIHQHFLGDEVKPSSGSRRANLTLRQVLSCTQWMYLICPLIFGSQLKDSTSISHHLMVGLNPIPSGTIKGRHHRKLTPWAALQAVRQPTWPRCRRVWRRLSHPMRSSWRRTRRCQRCQRCGVVDQISWSATGDHHRPMDQKGGAYYPTGDSPAEKSPWST